MKPLLDSFFDRLPLPAQVYFFGAYRDAVAASETHPQLVPGMLEQLILPPDLDELRPQMAALKEQLVAALEQAAKA
jgi:hypothetical protein